MITIRFPLILIAFLLAGCEPNRSQTQTPADADTTMGAATGRILVAELNPASGSSVSGTVTFTPGPDSTVTVSAVISGLEAGSRHGIHVHEFGDCSAPDASSAGGHFNPGGTPHGAPTDPADMRHAGDLGNLTEISAGVARFETNDPLLRLEGDWSIEGKSVVVHQGADDFSSQPSGAAGARIACGVIEAPAE